MREWNGYLSACKVGDVKKRESPDANSIDSVALHPNLVFNLDFPVAYCLLTAKVRIHRDKDHLSTRLIAFGNAST
ncbi:hypothetical protein FS842_001638 [Serendipita sp. 407]|nr:hypothetical protein FS842_001638 [Serendipita sp. 407]